MVLEEKTLELDKMIGTYKGEIQEMPRSIQGVDNIRRELDVNNKMYLFLLEKDKHAHCTGRDYSTSTGN
ncbi:MAG: hypothetical protein IPH24_07990 [Crocinitomicaceae bacterium]|nr:hypothetical protein [Crocinitomicaceae bacterium]